MYLRMTGRNSSVPTSIKFQASKNVSSSAPPLLFQVCYPTWPTIALAIVIVLPTAYMVIIDCLKYNKSHRYSIFVTLDLTFSAHMSISKHLSNYE